MAAEGVTAPREAHRHHRQVARDLELGARHRHRARPYPPEAWLQVHHCDPHTVLMRQSKAVTYEAPFLYLIFGSEKALLMDETYVVQGIGHLFRV